MLRDVINLIKDMNQLNIAFLVIDPCNGVPRIHTPSIYFTILIETTITFSRVGVTIQTCKS